MKRIKVLEALVGRLKDAGYRINHASRVMYRASCFLAIIVTFTLLGLPGGIVMTYAQGPEFTTDFRFEDCNFKERGENPYFILEPGYQLLLEGEDNDEEIRLLITVLPKVENIFVPGLGGVRTRVVEEREWINDVLIEVSRNFYVICEPRNDVAYFGERVFICEEGLVPNGDNFSCDGGEPSHDGEWRAGQPDGDGLAEPGIIMPGSFLLGSRYFQEIADDIALDRAENVKMGLTVNTDAGIFHDCVRVRETTPLEPGHVSIKKYCPRVGLVEDGSAKLADFGFNIE
jgi:hypothetical protein